LKQALLINPNSSRETTAMMVEIARANSPDDLAVIGATATRAPRMIVTREQLAAAGWEVVELARRAAADVSGIVIAAFGDPGIETSPRRQRAWRRASRTRSPNASRSIAPRPSSSAAVRWGRRRSRWRNCLRGRSSLLSRPR
jgi:Asp/Glu/Hydantoin racemase